MDTFFITIEDVEEDIARGWYHNREDLAADLNYNRVEDVVREMEWSACFKSSSKQKNHNVP